MKPGSRLKAELFTRIFDGLLTHQEVMGGIYQGL